MLRIAICDDNPIEMELIKKSIMKYADSYENEEISVYTNLSSIDLIQTIKNGKHYDIYFLDIVMPGVSGIEVGKAIREMDSDTPIIYITSSPEFALDAYSVNAIRYIIKPMEPGKVNEALDYVTKYLVEKQKHKYCIHTKDGLQSVLIENIVLVENYARSMVFTMADQTTITSICNRESFETQVANLLEEPEFLQPHKSYVINMKYVLNVTSDAFIMDNGMDIPISRRNLKVAKRDYLKYLMQENQGER